MADVPEIETKELQEHVEEAHHHADKEGAGWTRYVALSTASFAAFAAVGALHAGSLVNRAMIDQIKAADAWNEYQADKQKAHSYSIEANRLLDAGIAAPASRNHAASENSTAVPASVKAGQPPKHGASSKKDAGAKKSKAASAPVRKSAANRLLEYEGEAQRELDKSAKLAEEAKKREVLAEKQLETHENFAYSVALLQVAIALGAVSAIARSKPVWFASAVLGLIGIGFFAVGFLR